MENASFKVRIEQFEGPLDLLLHLIEEQELDIYEVKLAQITDQYLQYIYEAQAINLDLASDFLVMAARMLQIKVRRLLPVHQDDLEEEEDLTNFEEDLFRQLAQYKKYKEIVARLKEKREEIAQFTFREIDEGKIIEEYVSQDLLEDCNIEELSKAFRELLKNVREVDPVIEIVREEYSIRDTIDQIIYRVNEEKNGVRFTDFFREEKTRARIIITFLALLELIKNRKVRFVQNGQFAEIYILPFQEEI